MPDVILEHILSGRFWWGAATGLVVYTVCYLMDRRGKQHEITAIELENRQNLRDEP